MEKFLVGGAVRDMLLGIKSQDEDFVVVNSSHEEMIAKGFKHCGKDFSVYLDQNGDEHALARTEKKIGSGYHGFEAKYDGVSLTDDLMRRDLTINSMALDPKSGQVIDPWGGKQDLKNRILRHTSPAFSEDPLRVLRVARFAARYHPFGFNISPETLALMKDLSVENELGEITKQRVWLEFEKAFKEKHPEIFIKVLYDVGALKIIMPQLDKIFGVEQPVSSHPEGDVGTHSLLAVKCMKNLSDSPYLAFAALMHDIGKGTTPKEKWPSHLRHETNGLKPFDEIADEYLLPNKYKDIARIAIEYHTHIHRAFDLKPSTLLKLFSKVDAFRKPERLMDLCKISRSDSSARGQETLSEYPEMDYIISAFEAANSIDVKKALLSKAHPKIAIERARLEAIEKNKAERNNHLSSDLNCDM